MAAAVDQDSFLQFLGERCHMPTEEERIAADSCSDIQQNQACLCSDQSAFTCADGLQHQELRNDVQESGQHQGSKVNLEQSFPAQEIYSGKTIG